jgi:hypothetical protein
MPVVFFFFFFLNFEFRNSKFEFFFSSFTGQCQFFFFFFFEYHKQQKIKSLHFVFGCETEAESFWSMPLSRYSLFHAIPFFFFFNLWLAFLCYSVQPTNTFAAPFAEKPPQPFFFIFFSHQHKLASSFFFQEFLLPKGSRVFVLC